MKSYISAYIHKVDAAGAAQLGDPAGGKGRGGFCQHLGACDIKDSRQDSKHDGRDQRELIAAHGADELQQRAFEILGALGRGTSGSWHITHPPFPYSEIRGQVPSGSAGCARSPGTPGS